MYIGMLEGLMCVGSVVKLMLDVSLEDLNHNVSSCTHTCSSFFCTYLLFGSSLQHTLLKVINPDQSLCEQKSETEQDTVKKRHKKDKLHATNVVIHR